MPLIVETGTGLATADSWISLEEANAYWTDRADADWLAATSTSREAALRNAADYLMYAYRWPGQAAVTGQRLPWPRAGVRSGVSYYSAMDIPSQVIDAQLLLAIEALKGNILSKVTPAQGALLEETKKLEGLARTLKFAAPQVDDISRLRRFPMVDAILAGIAVTASNATFGYANLRRGL